MKKRARAAEDRNLRFFIRDGQVQSVERDQGAGAWREGRRWCGLRVKFSERNGLFTSIHDRTGHRSSQIGFPCCVFLQLLSLSSIFCTIPIFVNPKKSYTIFKQYNEGRIT